MSDRILTVADLRKALENAPADTVVVLAPSLDREIPLRGVSVGDGKLYLEADE